MIEGRPVRRLRLVTCPVCGEDLRGKVPANHIATEHGPEDLGLSPLRGGAP